MAVGDQVIGQGEWVYLNGNSHWYPWVRTKITEETGSNVTILIEGWIYAGLGDGIDYNNAIVQNQLSLYSSVEGYRRSQEIRAVQIHPNQGWIYNNDTPVTSYTVVISKQSTPITLRGYLETSGNDLYQGLSSTATTEDLLISSISTYTITYSGNATGVSGVPSQQIKNHDQSINLSTTIPVRTGYTFEGWATSSTATTVKYRAGITYSYSENANLVLYAVWSPITYTVAYNKNGGTWSNGTPANQTKVYNQPLALTSIKPTRNGYSFWSWNTKADGSGTNFGSNGTYNTNADAILYAQWTPNLYNISYNAKGGTNAPNPQTKIYGENLVLSDTIPTRTNYVFLGWDTDSAATDAKYCTGTNHTSNNVYEQNESIVLYAVWVPSTYTVTYNSNNGNWTGPSTQIKNYSEPLTLTSIEPTLDGYTFSGWGTNADGSGQNYSIGDTYNKDENVTLYALWKYTVTYNANSGSGNMATSSAFLGTSLRLRKNTFTKNLYNFDGWATSVNGAKVYNDQGVFVGRNTTLYAHWVEKPKGWINRIRLSTGSEGNNSTNDFVIGTTFDQVQYSESNSVTLLDIINNLKTFFSSKMFMFYKGKEPMNQNVMQWYQVIATTENPTDTETIIANS